MTSELAIRQACKQQRARKPPTKCQSDIKRNKCKVEDPTCLSALGDVERMMATPINASP